MGHPAPFPVELPLRLIELYTYRDDLVLDPFMGSGTTAVAAVRSGRRYVGYDTDSEYVRIAEQRADEERDAVIGRDVAEQHVREAAGYIRAHAARATDEEDLLIRAQREGMRARELARELLARCGFDEIVPNSRVTTGIDVSFSAVDRTGHPWYFDVSGAFTTTARRAAAHRHAVEGPRKGGRAPCRAPRGPRGAPDHRRPAGAQRR